MTKIVTTSSHYHGALAGFCGAAYGLLLAPSSGYRPEHKSYGRDRRVAAKPGAWTFMGESMDRFLALYGSLLSRSRLPAVVGKEESNKIAAILELACFACYG